MSKQSVVESIRAKMARLNNESENSKWFWSPPKSGEETDVRILPYQFGTDPFSELYFHYKLGNKGPLLCPKSTFGGKEECPVCDFVEDLFEQARAEYKKGNKKNMQYTQAMDIRAKLRVHCPIVVRGKESEGVKFWRFTETVYTTITAFYLNKTYGELQDVFQGRDLTVKALKKGPNDKYEPAPSVVPSGSATPLSEDKAFAANLIKSVPDVFTIVERKNEMEIKAILEAYIENVSPASSEELNKDLGKLKTSAAGSQSEPSEHLAAGLNSKKVAKEVEQSHVSGETDDVDDFLAKFGEGK